jgi:hypothetical protein
MEMTRLPNFLIIGAAKGGTTSLYDYFSQHPEIYMSPVKEPRFFALENEKLNFQNPDQAINQTSVTTLSEYLKLFDGVSSEIAVGEASPLYMYSAKAVDRIAHYIPEAKLIAILRNPVDRAYSCYKHLIALEPHSFAGALEAEDDRIKNNWAHLWHYRQGGYYYTQLQRYFDKFDSKQIRIYLFDDLIKAPLSITHDAFEFLGVDPKFTPNLTHKNVSNNPKIKSLQNIVNGKSRIRALSKNFFPKEVRASVARRIRGWNSKDFPPMSEDVKKKLIEVYYPDILQLEKLVGRDLSHWLK